MKTYSKSQWSDPSYYQGTEHLVLEVGTEGVLINFVRQVDDVLISSPDGDVLLAWAVTHSTTEFPNEECLYLSQKDNLKEIGKIEADLLAIRAVEGTRTVYITAQRN